MKILFEQNSSDFVYKMEIESIIYNRSNLDNNILTVVAENFASSIIDNINNNSKYIRDSLDIDEFDVEYIGCNLPTVILKFICPVLVDEDSLSSVVGRYTTNAYSEKFESTEDGEEATVEFRPIRGEMKVYLSSEAL